MESTNANNRGASPINATIERFELGAPTSASGLTMTPLLVSPVARRAGYITLAEGLATEVVHVTEVSDSGHVPELFVINIGDRPVLIVDGEELEGAKQNRIVNLTLVVPPHTKAVVPVTCVEQNRWSPVARRAKVGKNLMYARGRRRKMADVSQAMRERQAPRSNQHAVWEDVEEKMSRMNVHSASMAMDAIYDQSATSIDDIVSKFPACDGQVGAVMTQRGGGCGIEWFDAPSTWAAYKHRIVKSWAVDALDSDGETRGQSVAAEYVLQQLREETWTASASSGLGTDLRSEGRYLTAAALVMEATVIHLAGFHLRRRRGRRL